MIYADRRALKANLQQRIGEILTTLVNLYANNLNSLGVQNSVIATLAMAATISSAFDDEKVNDKYPYLSGIYYAFIQFALFGTLSNVVLCTISAAYGPSLALTGKSLGIIAYAVREMMTMQEYVFALGGASLLCLVMGIIIYGHANFTQSQAIVTTISSIIGVYVIYRAGRKSLTTIRYKGVKYLDEILKAFEGEDGGFVNSNFNKESLSGKSNFPAVSFSGPIWKRQEVHKGGNFTLLFASLDRGYLEFFKNKFAYDNGDDRLEKIEMKYLKLSLETRKVLMSSSIGNLGPQSSFSFNKDRYVDDRQLQFSLIPISDHEVMAATNIVEFQAVDLHSFKYDTVHGLKLLPLWSSIIAILIEMLSLQF